MNRKAGIMNKVRQKAFKPIDQEEKDLMESIERDEWQPVKDFDQERKKSSTSRAKYFKKR